MAPAPTGTAFCIASPRVRKQARGIADAEAAGRGQRGILAERMTGDEGRIPPHGKARLGFQHAQCGDRDRHQGGLGIFGELEGFGRGRPR